MKIQILSRKKLEALAAKGFEPETALISIADSDEEFAKLKNKPDYLLQLKFEDVGESVLDEFINCDLSDEENGKKVKESQPITPEQAQKIAAFYKEAKRKNVKLLICQCKYGQARSAACAAAFLEHSNGKGSLIFENEEKYCPNAGVYKAVLSALKNVEMPKC